MGLFRRKITADDKEVGAGATLTLKQSLIPCALVTILFFLWGFAYGLLDVLNSHFQTELNITPGMASGLSAAYFGAYFLMPLTISGWILRRYGFRVTFMTGLAILAVGCLLFWPSGVKRSFGGFCGSMFVVGAGLSTLETGADNFLSICGPPRYSEVRLNLAQGFQGIGSFVAPLLASRVFFASTVDDAQGLANVQWTYLGVAGFVALLIVLFFFAPMAEVTDSDMHLQEDEIAGEVGRLRDQTNLFFAISSQFCYVGAQVAVANYFINFSNLLAVAQGLFAASRFIGAGLMSYPMFKPRFMITVYLALCFVFCLAATTTTGKASVAMLILVLFFESICFATIFTLGLRGLGRHTKRGGSFLVAAISGGAVFPAMTGAVATHTKSFHHAMAIPVAGYALSLIFPIYINVFKGDSLDLHRTTNLNVDASHTVNFKDIQLEQSAGLDTSDKGAVERIESA